MTAPERGDSIEENFQPVVVIMLMRLYDVGMALLATQNPNAADSLAEAHRQGAILGPAPAIALVDEEKNDSSSSTT